MVTFTIFFSPKTCGKSSHPNRGLHGSGPILDPQLHPGRVPVHRGWTGRHTPGLFVTPKKHRGTEKWDVLNCFDVFFFLLVFDMFWCFDSNCWWLMFVFLSSDGDVIMCVLMVSDFLMIYFVLIQLIGPNILFDCFMHLLMMVVPWYYECSCFTFIFRCFTNNRWDYQSFVDW